MTPCYILLTRDVNFHYRQTDKVVGSAGDIFTITDGDRFRSEFDPKNHRAEADPGFVILDDTTAQELIDERNAVVERRRKAEERARSKAEVADRLETIAEEAVQAAQAARATANEAAEKVARSVENAVREREAEQRRQAQRDALAAMVRERAAQME